PSSPSPVDSLRPESSRRSALYTSAPARTASAIEGAPTGATMNSWKSSALGACMPPLSTLKCGTGREGGTPSGVIHCHSGIPAEAASARASAIEVPTVALAPSRLLFSVPSRSIMAWSASAREVQGRPRRRSRISVLTAATAPRTPLPSYLSGSPSRRSTASREPVEAPDGTPARAAVPSASRTVTARVGRPRESRISRAERSATSNVAIICSYPGVPVRAARVLSTCARAPGSCLRRSRLRRVSRGLLTPSQVLAGQPSDHAEPGSEAGRGQTLGQLDATGDLGLPHRCGDHVTCLVDPYLHPAARLRPGGRGDPAGTEQSVRALPLRGRIRNLPRSVPVRGGSLQQGRGNLAQGSLPGLRGPGESGVGPPARGIRDERGCAHERGHQRAEHGVLRPLRLAAAVFGSSLHRSHHGARLRRALARALGIRVLSFRDVGPACRLALSPPGLAAPWWHGSESNTARARGSRSHGPRPLPADTDQLVPSSSRLQDGCGGAEPNVTASPVLCPGLISVW